MNQPNPLTTNLPSRHNPEIPAVWYNGLPEASKQELKRLLTESGPVFDALRNMLKKMYAEAQSVASDYENPNWAYLQAHKNGRMQVLQDLHRLLP